MNDSTKKVLLVVVVVVALVVAGFGARNYMKSEQGEVVRTITLPPGQSMKKREMERQQRERSGTAPATGGAGERDLSGSMGER
jgi:cell division protein YceG involved in septum cleavage